MPTRLTNEIITAAIEGYEGQKKRIEEQIGELRAMLSDGPAAKSVATAVAPTPKRRGKMSAAGRKAVAAAQRKRWAKIKAESEPAAPAAPEPKKARRKISAEGMKRIIAATKKRWRLAKAAKEQAPVAKKAAVKKAAVKASKKTAKKSAPAKKAAVSKVTAKEKAAATAQATGAVAE